VGKFLSAVILATASAAAVGGIACGEEPDLDTARLVRGEHLTGAERGGHTSGPNAYATHPDDPGGISAGVLGNGSNDGCAGPTQLALGVLLFLNGRGCAARADNTQTSDEHLVAVGAGQ